MRILLIEDSIAYHDEFESLLAESRVQYSELHQATTGGEGARLLVAALYDIYFVDYRLPGTDGLDLIRRARTAGLTKPIIVLTGFDNPDVDFAAEQAGANDFLEKGKFAPQILGRAIRYALSNAANERLTSANAALERMAASLTQARLEADQASRAKTRFLASMSHELRTPLNGILGYAQLLRLEGGLSVTQSERVQAMLAAGRHLLDTISCVLDLSAIETKGVELQQSSVDVAELAQTILDIVRPAAEAKQLQLRLLMTPDMPPRLLTDPSRLRQVLLNLLGNAVKYTALGSVTLRLSAASMPDGAAGEVCFEVADTGPGIPPAMRHRLFEAFDRLGADTAGTNEGAGLGLSLARRLATLLGGSLGYEDNPAGGSIFRLQLPLLAGSAPAVVTSGAEHPSADATPAVDRKASRVLVVDDVAINRDIASAFIQSACYEVVCVEGGAQAVEAAAKADFVVILMDVCMPEVDGLEATRRIRALQGPRAQVPIVAMTAQVFTEQIEECRRAGMDSHLAKPFTQENLLDAVAAGAAAVRARSAALACA
jgi:signal transduction histidine kinase